MASSSNRNDDLTYASDVARLQTPIPDMTPAVYDRSDGSESDSQENESDEDPLCDGATQAPLRDTVNAVASNHKGNTGQPSAAGRKRAGDGHTPSDARSKKRSRIDDAEDASSRIMSRVFPFDRGMFSCLHLDPISCGLLSEEDAVRLYIL